MLKKHFSLFWTRMISILNLGLLAFNFLGLYLWWIIFSHSKLRLAFFFSLPFPHPGWKSATTLFMTTTDSLLFYKSANLWPISIMKCLVPLCRFKINLTIDVVNDDHHFSAKISTPTQASPSQKFSGKFVLPKIIRLHMASSLVPWIGFGEFN